MTDEERSAASQRLEILEALVAAIERRSEVFEAIAASKSADHARIGLAEMLRVSEIGATAILDLQWRRMAEDERNRIVADRDQIRATLD